jgi:hypothetical protein
VSEPQVGVSVRYRGLPASSTGGAAGSGAEAAATLNKGHDTRAIQGWLSHRSITSSAVYTALAPNRFKDFWRD